MVNDLLARIKNAGMARRETLQAPFSGLDFEIAKILEREGFLKKVEKRGAGKKSFLDITLNYRGRNPAISGFKIISKPGRRLYAGYRDLKAVRRGYGIAVLSTPEGVLTDKEARKKKVGGEQLFQVW
jgi:small subunit ribosomal protein S8